MAINDQSVSLLQYSICIVDWTKAELCKMDKKTRKLFTVYGALQSRANVDRPYLPRSAWWPGPEIWSWMSMKGCRNSNGEGKMAYWRIGKRNPCIASFWDKRARLRRAGCGLSTDKTCDDAKRTKCLNTDEAVSHTVSEGSKLAQRDNKSRHDGVARAVHWNLCRKHGLECKPDKWHEHEPESVVESENVRILWDFAIQTDHIVEHGRPNRSRVQLKIIVIIKGSTKILTEDPSVKNSVVTHPSLLKINNH